MNKIKSIKGISLIVTISIIIMSIVNGFIDTGYIQKSAIKIVMFFIFPILYTLYDKNINIRENFKIKSIKSLLYSFLLGIGIYIVILVAYFVLKSFIDLSNIIELLDKDVNINRENFTWVAIYIPMVNSLLEEFFFRGFIFLNIKRLNGRKFAYIISAFVFALYHVAIMGNWFSPIIFILAMSGLFVGGLIFNYLNDRDGNIYNSWIVHMMANLSINTVGLMMFGLI